MKPNPHQKVTQCAGCGSTQLFHYLKLKDYFLTKEEFEILQCQNCKLLLTNPIPGENEIEKYYQSPEYYSHNSKANNLNSIIYNIIRHFNIRRKYSFVKSLTTGNHILDYGCGSGQLLNYFKQMGWQIQGVEKNADARYFASELNRIDVAENLDQIKATSTQFDVIMLWHVLEHIHKLNELVTDLGQLLRKNGILLIAVPNPLSFDAMQYKEMWAGYDVPRHLYHFSRESMEKFLEKHYFHTIATIPMKFDAYYTSLLSEKYKGNRFPYFKAFIEGYKSNHFAQKNKNYSSMIFVARKI